LVLKQTSALYNEDPPGAPLPLGRRQYDAGTIEMLGQQIGEYLRIKEVHAVTLNTAAVTITLFFPSATPVPITLGTLPDRREQGILVTATPDRGAQILRT
jgi:hypothetical protein